MIMNYQNRYLEHQKNKKTLFEKESETLELVEKTNFDEVITSRRSTRKFFGKMINKEIKSVIDYAKFCPTSCNRQAIWMKIVKSKKEKDLLEELLVGGKNWINKAGIIVLLFADMDAYKSPNEVTYMPYLDAGVLSMTLSLGAEKLGYGSCIVNPNIRQKDLNKFNNIFNKKGYKFCISLAVGKKGIQLDPRQNNLNIC